jgi:hypothetical protein
MINNNIYNIYNKININNDMNNIQKQHIKKIQIIDCNVNNMFKKLFLELKVNKIKKIYEKVVDFSLFKLQNIIESDIEIKANLFEKSINEAKFYACCLKIYGSEFKNWSDFEIPKIGIPSISDEIYYEENDSDTYTKEDLETFSKDMENIKNAKNLKSIKYIKKMLYDDSEIETEIKWNTKKVVRIKTKIKKKLIFKRLKNKKF